MRPVSRSMPAGRYLIGQIVAAIAASSSDDYVDWNKATDVEKFPQTPDRFSGKPPSSLEPVGPESGGTYEHPRALRAAGPKLSEEK